MAEEKPVERGVVRGELRLQIVDNLLNDEGQLRSGKVAIARGLRAGLRLKFVQELAYLVDPLIHVGENSTPTSGVRGRIERSAKDDGQRKPIEALDADSLQGDSAQAGLTGHHFQASARADNVRLGAFGLDDAAVASDIIDDDDGSAM
jgi:hypothetical protein